MTTIDSDERETPFTRRAFLQFLRWSWALPALIGLRPLIQYISFQAPGTDPSLIVLGAPQSLQPFPRHLEKARLFLQKDEAGYFALDNVCTHLGCLIHPETEGGFACPCHGSRYTADGQVTRGPAVRPLAYLELHWDGTGQIVVDRSKQVTNTFRLADL